MAQDKIWKNWHDIIQHYESISDTIPYRQYLPKPKKEKDENNTSFGKRLDEYDKMIAEKRVEDNKNQIARNKVFDEMEHEIFKYFSLEWDNVKARKAWSIAWEHGHSSGYNDVVNYFEDLVDLIK